MIRIEKSWNRILDKYRIDDLQFREEYAKLYGDANFFYKETNNDLIFLILIINRKYNDFETPYGYSSFYTTNNEMSFTERFFDEIIKILNREKLIAGLIRFNPFYDPPKTDLFEIEYVRDVYHIDLKEDFYRDFKDSVKNKINRALKGNYEIVESNSSDEFIKFYYIYNDMMRKKRSTKDAYFSKEYFESLSKTGFSKILNVYYKDEYLGGSIFLSGKGKNSYYHLSSLEKTEIHKGLSNLLVFKGCKIAQNDKSERLVLGGGLSSNADDGLSKFKMSFTSKSKKFYIGKIIVDKKEYERLIKIYEEKIKNSSNLFLRYRDILT